MTEAGSEGASAADRHGRIDDIEVLRGIAITMVLFEHLPINLIVWHSHFLAFLDHYCRGWVGVDLFFVISGFVIARGLLPLRARAADRLQYAHGVLAFWIQRAWRLLPSAWLWLGVPLLASIVFNRGGFFDPPANNFTCLVTGALNVANFHEIHAYRVEHCNSFPYWSLSLEEQFYLILPVLLFVTGRWLPAVMLAAIAIQFAEPPTLLFMFTRPGAFAFGVLLAMASGTRLWKLCEPTGLSNNAPGRAAILLVPLIFMGALGSGQLHIVEFKVGLIALLAALLVWIASYDRNLLVTPRMPRQLLMWLGSRAYSLYLTHIPAFSATREIWLRLSPPGTIFDRHFALRFVLTAGALTLAFTELNFRFVERPLRRRGRRIAQAFASRPLLS